MGRKEPVYFDSHVQMCFGLYLNFQSNDHVQSFYFCQESLQNHISETEKQIKQLKCEHEEMVESLTTEHAQKIESMSNEHKAKIQVLSIRFSVKSIDNIHATDY